MEAILRKAAALGKAIGESDTCKALLEAEKQIDADGQVRKLMAEYDACSRGIQEKERKLEPVEVADKRRLQALHEQMQSNALVQGLLRAQADYAQMMTQVHGAIESNLKPR